MSSNPLLPKGRSGQIATSLLLSKGRSGQIATSSLLSKGQGDQIATSSLLSKGQGDQIATSSLLSKGQGDQIATSSLLSKDPGPPKLFTLKELSKRWRVPQKTVMEWAITKPRGKPPLEIVMKRGEVYITADSVEAWDAKWLPDTPGTLDDFTILSLSTIPDSFEVLRTYTTEFEAPLPPPSASSLGTLDEEKMEWNLPSGSIKFSNPTVLKALKAWLDGDIFFPTPKSGTYKGKDGPRNLVNSLNRKIKKATELGFNPPDDRKPLAKKDGIAFDLPRSGAKVVQ